MESINKFFDLSRDLRFEHECYLYTNDDSHAKNMLKTVAQIKALLLTLKHDIIAERKMTNYYEAEFAELESLLSGTLNKNFDKYEQGTRRKKYKRKVNDGSEIQ